MPKHDHNYFSYLLRAWREHDNAEWRFSLEGAFGQEKFHFRDFASLIAFLANKVKAGETTGLGGKNARSEETISESTSGPEGPSPH